ncbi:lipopolysaccharide biosynthesis protein [Oryzomicrobium terrae]|nr:hypothetical protein [Oryzomicrobium terrae]
MREKIIWLVAYCVEKGANFIFLPLVVAAFGAKSYSIYAQTLASAAMISVVVILGQGTLLIKNNPEGDCEKIRIYINKVVVIFAIEAIFLLGLFLVYGRDISVFVYGGDVSFLFLFFIVAFAFVDVAFEVVCVSALRARSEFKRGSFFVILKTAGKLVPLIGCLWVKVELVEYMMLSLALQGGLVIIQYANSCRGKRRAGQSVRVMDGAFDVVVNALLVTGLLSVSRYVLVNKTDIFTVGYYSAITTITGVVAILYSGTGYFLYTKIVKQWAGGDFVGLRQLYLKALAWFVLIAATLSFLVCIAGDLVFSLVYGEGVKVGAWSFLFLALFQVLFGVYQFSYYVILMGAHTRYNFFLIGPAIALLVVVQGLVIPHHGLVGAAFVQMMVMGVVAGISVLVVMRRLRARITL